MVRTEIAKEQNLIRLTGSYDICCDAARAIVNDVRKIEVERLHVLASMISISPETDNTAYWRKHLDEITGQDSFWQYIGEMTGTLIKPISKGIDPKVYTHFELPVSKLIGID
jgi:hypothetical protein